MDTLITTQNITFTLGVLGVIFGVYKHFKNPQIDLDKQQAVGREEVQGKAALLAQQVQWEKELNEKKYTEFSKRLDDAFTLAQNHIHTVDTRVQTLTTVITAVDTMMKTEFARLNTILEERLPRK